MFVQFFIVKSMIHVMWEHIHLNHTRVKEILMFTLGMYVGERMRCDRMHTQVFP